MNMKMMLTTETRNACDSLTNNLTKSTDLELTDDTEAKRAKLFDTPSSSSSSHEVAPNLHDS